MTRRPWVLPLLVVLLVAVPIAEVWLLIQVGQAIGVLPTVLILVAEAALGGVLMRREGAKAWAALTTAFASGRLPAGELADAALVLVGGVLLMLPGFLTDVLGFFFLLPWTRPLARRVLLTFAARQVGGVIASRQMPDGVLRGDVIPGETVDAPEPRTVRGELGDGPEQSPRPH